MAGKARGPVDFAKGGRLPSVIVGLIVGVVFEALSITFVPVPPGETPLDVSNGNIVVFLITLLLGFAMGYWVTAKVSDWHYWRTTPNIILSIEAVAPQVHADGSGMRTGTTLRARQEANWQLNLPEYQISKPNANILITGGSGEGKSVLTLHVLNQVPRTHESGQEIIWSFKPHDHYLTMGFPIVRMRQVPPNVFADPEAFTNAWMVAFPLGVQGIQASLVPNLVRELAKTSRSWESFFSELERRLGTERDNNLKSALAFIHSNSKALDVTGRQGSYHLGEEDVVFDFSGLNRDAATFYAEYTLRQVWNQLLEQQRGYTILCVDEAHRLLRTQGRYHSVFSEVTREIRAFGAVVTTTQNISDVPEHDRNQFATQFAFRSRHAEDLMAVGHVNDELKYALAGLMPHEFVDLMGHNIHNRIPIWCLRNPAIEEYPEQDARVQAEPVPEPSRPRTNESMSAPGSSSGGAVPFPPPAVDYEQEISGMVARSPAYPTAIARTIATRHNMDVEKTKLKVKDHLKRMVKAGEMGQSTYDQVPDGSRYVVLYYRRGPNMSGLHDYMVDQVKEVLDQSDVPYRETPQGQDGADLILTNPKTGRDLLAIEVETGLKHDQSDVNRRQRESGTQTIVVVPSKSDKGSYPGLDVRTVAEFGEHVRKTYGG